MTATKPTIAIEPRIVHREGGWWRLRRRILGHWIQSGISGVRAGWAAKTDLFDEASGPHHHLRGLAAGHRVIGLDWDLDVARAAQLRLQRQGHEARLIVCDVRALPFSDSSLTIVLSLSTLDHFEEVSSIEDSLKEISRALRVEGRLLLTLDNPWNPEVFLREWLPAGLVQRMRADTFPIGKTMNARKAEKAFRLLNLEVTGKTYLIHGPRFASIRALNWLEGIGAQRLTWAVEAILVFLERLSLTPISPVTGHYTGWWLRKAGGG